LQVGDLTRLHATLGRGVDATAERFEPRSQREIEVIGAPLQAARRAELRRVVDQAGRGPAEVRVVAPPVELRVIGIAPLRRETRERRDRTALEQIELAACERALDVDDVPVRLFERECELRDLARTLLIERALVRP